jgi:hypothetical protein
MATRKSGGGGAKPSGQISDVRREAEKFKKAAAGFGQAVVELWSARIDVAISAGDEEEIAELVKNPARALALGGRAGTVGGRAATARPIEGTETQLYDSNGNCGCGGDGTGTAGW